MSLTFEEVDARKDHTQRLFNLLQKRENNISHLSMPSFFEHNKFVKSHPYRAWFIVKLNAIDIGTLYLTKENVIGINLISGHQSGNSIEAIKFVIKNYKPYPEIKSLRQGFFICNVSPANKVLEDELKATGFKKLQHTYEII